MIAGIFHQGSGLGNQLHRYVATRVKALDLGVDFGMIYNPDSSGKEMGFKGKSFMNIDTGKVFGDILPPLNMSVWKEETNYYNPEFNFIEDNTIIDGEFQDSRYFEHHMDKILGWLNINPELLAGFYDEICVIAFRGGEFTLYPDLMLTKEYYDDAITEIRKLKPNIVLKVVTDDIITARQYFPNFEISHEIADDWTSILNAHYLIISNSSFAIFPALLNKNAKKIIAPRYWARHNIKQWSMPQNYYKRFTYI